VTAFIESQPPMSLNRMSGVRLAGAFRKTAMSAAVRRFRVLSLRSG
jgi:hypothetical protein